MQTSSARWLAGITLGVVALAVVAIVVTLTAGDPDPLPEGSPEAAVQDFVQAIDEGDFAIAYGMLASEAQENCREAEFRDRVFGGRDTDMRVTLESVDTFDADATVTVRIRNFSGSPPFDFSESSYTSTFQLERESGDWKIVLAPWPFGGCYFPARELPVPTATPTPTPTPAPAAS